MLASVRACCSIQVFFFFYWILSEEFNNNKIIFYIQFFVTPSQNAHTVCMHNIFFLFSLPFLFFFSLLFSFFFLISHPTPTPLSLSLRSSFKSLIVLRRERKNKKRNNDSSSSVDNGFINGAWMTNVSIKCVLNEINYETKSNAMYKLLW